MTVQLSLIYLPASEGGHLPSDGQGLNGSRAGQGAHPVSHSPSQDKRKDSKTSATSGQCGTVSFRSADLQLSLESNLQAELDGLGSPVFDIKWRRQDIESQVPICAQVAWARRTKGSGFTSEPWPTVTGYLAPWPTPTNRDRSSEVERLNPTTRRYGQAVFLIGGPMSSSAQIKNGVRLNPEHPRWLMGYPAEWSSYVDTATPSCHSLAQPSSEHL